ncbi:2-succinyl-5-enolpyruvyl-6-hydroxy-3-cyclohexene-1-carboxylic-acid synthase [Flavobacterium cerinum]|uniref:2-succinyl-5-enolpyruvyl-6-hydroxy-3-cyclohexene-1-carboxylate synthase n=1 Tax=Flavobacterium cerinum TaxID=2502784 RepID=A0ABY5IPB6_9FLAO|nr:2-succinyl-5-enolpyruvyl-6-hydroxy-3-cyclohexene-1-carboxylic-acid synthase [Flavobacterium cerinum]UUC44678.1 2-succinyl-5-enolpyruvyl-6-hydroxy-3-cyclohexene-1-carboxylic-acid synthase [Flavobacterium cerinum]
MAYPKIPLAQSVMALCKAKGLLDIIISPGSRNAPLTIGFASNKEFNCYSIADERCAAFMAIGMAQQLKKPVALVCTSGSALLNYYPAVAEAFYSQLPLVVISADRPTSKIDIGDGQTIRQQNVYANHILYSANLTEENSAENDAKINEAITIAIRQKGPVHINVPFEEPLYEVTETLSVHPEVKEPVKQEESLPDWTPFIQKWSQAKKKLILIGTNDPGVMETAIIEQLANDDSIVVMKEVTSNIHHPHFIGNIDTIITPFTENDFIAFQPEILITIGGMVVSKRVKAFLRKYQPEEHWHVDPLRAYDTFGCLSQHFKCMPNRFFKAVLAQDSLITSDYLPRVKEIQKIREAKHKIYADRVPYSDFTVFQTLLPALPANTQLQISNSSAIRYAQLFSIDPSIDVFCNRGTSGIDGSTSTAIGAAIAANKETLLITGDISFLYDSNALWNAYIPKNFKIILINNGGGGIFRILPGHQETEVFNTYFETAHHLTAEHLAAMYKFRYMTVNDQTELENALPSFLSEKAQPALLEIHTPMEVNDKILLEYFKNLT